LVLNLSAESELFLKHEEDNLSFISVLLFFQGKAKTERSKSEEQLQVNRIGEKEITRT